MSTRLFILLILAVVATPVCAQTAPAVELNAQGVSMLHIHIYPEDTDAQRAFWLALIGDPPPTGRGLNVGGLTVSVQAGEPEQGNEGSAIEYVAFRVSDLKATLARLEATGGGVVPGAETGSAFVMAPEGVKVLVTEDTALDVAVVQDHVHVALPSASDAIAWYAKTFGAVPSRDGDGWTLPGVVLRATEGQKRESSKGRTLDHIAFNVTDLYSFIERLQGMGIETEPVTEIGNRGRGYTYLEDPWGIRIELMGPTAPPGG